MAIENTGVLYFSSATQIATGSYGWTSMSAALADDGSYANCHYTNSGYSHTLRTYGVSVPLSPDAIVLGVKADIQVAAGARSVYVNLIRLVVDGNEAGTNLGDGHQFSGGEQEVSYGSASATWGINFTHHDFDSGFGVDLILLHQLPGTVTDAYVDVMKTTVWYEPGRMMAVM